MEPAVDTARFGVNLSNQGREQVTVAVSPSEDLDPALVLKRVSEMPDTGIVQQRVKAVEDILAPAMTNILAPARFGAKLESLVSNWWPTYSVKDLINLLTIAVALNNASSGKCASISLRRALPLFRDPQRVDVQISLVPLLETTLYHYGATDLEVDFADLRDVFHSATAIPFPLLARVGGRLMAGNRDGTQRLEPSDFVKSLLSPSRIATVSQAEIREGIKLVIAERRVSEWKRILPLLYFDRDASNSEFGIASATFLQHCFSADNPSLLLALLPSGEQTWLVKTEDLGGLKLSEQDLHELIQTNGVIAPEIAENDEQFGDDFFDRVANARRNANLWMKNHVNNVVRLVPRRGR